MNFVQNISELELFFRMSKTFEHMLICDLGNRRETAQCTQTFIHTHLGVAFLLKSVKRGGDTISQRSNELAITRSREARPVALRLFAFSRKGAANSEQIHHAFSRWRAIFLGIFRNCANSRAVYRPISDALSEATIINKRRCCTA